MIEIIVGLVAAAVVMAAAALGVRVRQRGSSLEGTKVASSGRPKAMYHGAGGAGGGGPGPGGGKPPPPDHEGEFSMTVFGVLKLHFRSRSGARTVQFGLFLICGAIAFLIASFGFRNL